MATIGSRFRTTCAAGILFLALSGNALASDIEGRILVRSARDSANAVVFIDKIAGAQFTPPAEPVVLDQVNLTFVPHVLPVLVGTNVAFPNRDEIRHNVFSPGPPALNLGTYPMGQTKYHRFTKPGVWTMLCNVHAEMSAYVVVTETPYFALTDKEGKYVLKGVPPGKYTLRVWHQRAKPQALQVEVRGDTMTLQTIELKR